MSAWHGAILGRADPAAEVKDIALPPSWSPHTMHGREVCEEQRKPIARPGDTPRTSKAGSINWCTSLSVSEPTKEPLKGVAHLPEHGWTKLCRCQHFLGSSATSHGALPVQTESLPCQLWPCKAESGQRRDFRWQSPGRRGRCSPRQALRPSVRILVSPWHPADKSLLHPGTSFPPSSTLAKAVCALGKAGSLIPGPNRDIVRGQKGKQCVRPFAHCALSLFANTAQHFHCQPCGARGGCSRHTA